eukprot:4990805-Prymnesium_polylepis.1
MARPKAIRCASACWHTDGTAHRAAAAPLSPRRTPRRSCHAAHDLPAAAPRSILHGACSRFKARWTAHRASRAPSHLALGHLGVSLRQLPLDERAREQRLPHRLHRRPR